MLARKNTKINFLKKNRRLPAFRYRVKSINLYAKHAAIALALHKSTVFISHAFADSLEW